MATVQQLRNDTSEAAIFARLWESRKAGLTPLLARHVLKLAFSDDDLQRMHELAARNQEGTISQEEREALDNYVKVGDLLAILQSKARKLLNKTSARNHQRG